MSIVQLPEHFVFSKVKNFKLQRAGNVIQSRYTGSEQKVVFPFAVWMIEGSVSISDGIKAGEIRSFLVNLEGMKNTFKLSVPGWFGPLSGYQGNAKIASLGSPNSTSFIIKDVNPNANIFKDGDYLTINDELKIVKGSVNSDESGVAIVEFRPALRKTVNSNDHVEIQKPYCIMYSPEDDIASWPINPPSNYSFNLVAYEAIGFDETPIAVVPTIGFSGPPTVVEGGTANYVFTRSSTSGISSFRYTIKAGDTNPISATYLENGFATGVITFNEGDNIKNLQVTNLQNILDEPDKKYKIEITELTNSTLTNTENFIETTVIDDDGSNEPVPNHFKIILLVGDSYTPGVYTRESQDTNWPNVYQIKMREGAGYLEITPDTTPLVHYYPGNNISQDYLSYAEYFAKRETLLANEKILLIPMGWNGTRFYGPNAMWGPGKEVHEATIPRVNAALAQIIAAYPGSYLGGILWAGGANDGMAGEATQGQAFGAYSAVISDFRARINGAANVPLHIMGMLTELLNNNSIYNQVWRIELALRQYTASTQNTFFTPYILGFNGDYLHSNNAGHRWMGDKIPYVMRETTPPINNVANINNNVGDTLNYELTGENVIYWSLTGQHASQFKIVSVTSNKGVKFYLRTVDEAPVTSGTRNITINSISGSRIVTSNSITVTTTSAQSGGGPVASTVIGIYTDPNNKGNRNWTINNINFTAGEYLFVIRLNGNGAPMPSLKANNVSGIKLGAATTNDTFEIWKVVLNSGATGSVVMEWPQTINYNASDLIIYKVENATNYVVDFVPYSAWWKSPFESAEKTYPANGEIIGGGFFPGGNIAVLNGCTETGRLQASSGMILSMKRTTTGKIGATSNGPGYRGIFTIIASQ